MHVTTASKSLLVMSSDAYLHLKIIIQLTSETLHGTTYALNHKTISYISVLNKTGNIC